MSGNAVVYKASAMDMLRSKARIVCALGPADFGGIERIRERLHRLASAGPAARVGLRVDPSSQKWTYEADLVCSDVLAIAPLTAAEVPARLVEFASTDRVDIPVRARLGGEYLLLSFSHGISDAVLAIEVFAFLADPTPDPDLPAWATAHTVRNPLPRALAGWMARNPRKVVDVLYGKVRPAPADKPVELLAPAPTEPPRRPWAPSPALTGATSPAGTPSELRAWRKRHNIQASVTALLCAAITTALAKCDVPTAYSAGFLFDCRRYLRADGIVLGNFAVGIDFEGIDPTSPEQLHRSLTHAIDKGRPLAAGALSALAYLRSRSAMPAVSTDTAPSTAVAQLTFSDIGRVPQIENIDWADEPGQCLFYPLSQPTIPESIVLTSLNVRDAFHVTASFHDNFFDSAAIQAALTLAVSHPIALLSHLELAR